MMGVPAHKRPVTTVFQNYALFPHLDVYENVAFGLRERKTPNDQVRENVNTMLELVNLTGRNAARPKELSGGQQQRIALARSLVLDPEVLLLDEPLGALDLRLRKQLQGLLKNVQREVGITFVYVTHDQEEAFSMSDRVAVLRAGLIEQVGPPRAIYAEPQPAFVADFVGGANRIPVTIVEATADSYRVDAGRLGVWTSAGISGLQPGQNATAIIRPETVQIGSGDVSVEGRVTDLSFVGPVTNLAVACGELEIRCTVSGRTSQPELATRFGWNATDSWIVSADAEAAPA
jgi:spermidine/putrescine transport system ATP-binding protein